MTLNEYREAHFKDPEDEYLDLWGYDYRQFKTKKPDLPHSSTSPDPNQMVIMGPKVDVQAVLNYSNLKAGLCPICQAIVREVPSLIQGKTSTTQVQCVENRDHFFIVVASELKENH